MRVFWRIAHRFYAARYRRAMRRAEYFGSQFYQRVKGCV